MRVSALDAPGFNHYLSAGTPRGSGPCRRISVKPLFKKPPCRTALARHILVVVFVCRGARNGFRVPSACNARWSLPFFCVSIKCCKPARPASFSKRCETRAPCLPARESAHFLCTGQANRTLFRYRRRLVPGLRAAPDRNAKRPAGLDARRAAIRVIPFPL
jgi:hypothetical protein